MGVGIEAALNELAWSVALLRPRRRPKDVMLKQIQEESQQRMKH